MQAGDADAIQALNRAVEVHPGSGLASVLRRRELGEYAGYAGMLRRVRGLREAGARLELVGASVCGEPLLCVALGPRDAPASTLVAGLHPMEWIGIETALTLLEAAVCDPPSDRQLIAFPMANPDGVLKVESLLLRGRRRFVRHNARGVDLNRNFPSFWGGSKLANRLLRKTFAPGSGPSSEPEVKAITGRVATEAVDRALSLHSFGGVVLFPYGAMRELAANHEDLAAWARQIAMAADPGRPYRAVQSARWVPGFTASGMELDWFYDRFSAVSLLIECSRGGVLPGLKRLAHCVDPFAWFNPRDVELTAKTVAEAALPFLRGDPLDAVRGSRPAAPSTQSRIQP